MGRNIRKTTPLYINIWLVPIWLTQNIQFTSTQTTKTKVTAGGKDNTPLSSQDVHMITIRETRQLSPLKNHQLFMSEQWCLCLSAQWSLEEWISLSPWPVLVALSLCKHCYQLGQRSDPCFWWWLLCWNHICNCQGCGGLPDCKLFPFLPEMR